MSILPEHVAVIMDGNGRWAEQRGYDRIIGHIRGAQNANTLIKQCAKLQLKYLTLFAFSTENWLRPQQEVTLLMGLLAHHLRRERRHYLRDNICFSIIGSLDELPKNVQFEITETVAATKHNSGMKLIFAVNYSSRRELLAVAKLISSDIVRQKLQIADVNVALISSRLATNAIPDPALIIRTGGERRLSNFLMWQASQAQIHFEEKMWPDFKIQDFQHICQLHSQTRSRPNIDFCVRQRDGL